MKLLREYVFKGIIKKEDKDISDYKYFFFKVPEETRIIHISYKYSRSIEDENVLDIGVFDSKESFRGWSGSNRSEIFISENAATPGYLYGRIHPGLWKIILGLYKISKEGCYYKIKVSIIKARREQREKKSIDISRELSIKTKNSKIKTWFRGDLHVHTNHSDGAKSIHELVNEAKIIGLDFIALTDHNTISQNLHAAKYESSKIFLMPAEEVTTYYGHANVWGNRKWVDFRRSNMEDFQELINEVHAQGLLFSINHPQDEDFPDSYWKFKEIRGFDCVEVWHGPWTLYDYRSLIWWDSLLQKGERIIAVGGSDFHGTGSSKLGNPTTWIYSDMLSINSILRAIKRGHLFISKYVDGPQIYLYADIDDDGRIDSICGDEICLPKNNKLTIYAEVKRAKGSKLKLISKGEAVKIEEINDSDYIVAYRTRAEKNGYFRAEVVKACNRGEDKREIPEILALTNPIYVRIKTA